MIGIKMFTVVLPVVSEGDEQPDAT